LLETSEPIRPQLSALDRASQLEESMAQLDVALSVRLPPVEPPHAVGVDMQRRTFHELDVVDMRCGPLLAARTNRLVQEANDALMIALLVHDGAEIVGHVDTAAVLSRGDLLLWNCERPARFAVADLVSKRLMVVPADLFDSAGTKRIAQRGFTVVRRSPATQLLDHFLGTLVTSEDCLGSAASAGVRNAVLELLFGSLQPDPSASIDGSTIALRPAVERWIDQHLTDMVITPTSVAVAHAVSVRTVHRMFAETGDTLGSVVRLRRLNRVRGELECTDHTIAAIASRWGFCDSSHLNRIFKRQFGLSPSDYRAQCWRGVGLARKF